MTLQWITTPSACQKLRFSTKSMLGILVRRTEFDSLEQVQGCSNLVNHL